MIRKQQGRMMDDFSPSDLKTILHSKRANLYYLQHCRVLVNGGRVEYVTDEGSKSRYWNIPIANTTSLLLGTGTSITQAAMRELSKAGVLVGFCGGGGTPLAKPLFEARAECRRKQLQMMLPMIKGAVNPVMII